MLRRGMAADEELAHRAKFGAWVPAIGEWQPIKTAPRDIAILGYADGDMATVKWAEGDQYYKPKGYWQLTVVGAEPEDDEWKPTHWMPLPKPPSEPPAPTPSAR